MNDLFDLIKNILICCCLCATLCSTCRQEQAQDRMSAEIAALKNVSSDLQECAFQPQENAE